jgi:propionate catabolism operon transcriptional regulator
MSEKIGVIASDEELKNRIIKLFPEEVKNGEIIIDILDSDKMEDQGRILEKKGAKAIVARSGGYAYTVGKVNVPVINLKITTLDILLAVKNAVTHEKKIVLFISVYDYFDYNDLKDLLKTKVEIERFSVKEEIEPKVKKYIGMKDQVIVIGGGIPCRCAKELGIENIHLGASNESIHEAISNARNIANNIHEKKFNYEVLKTTLDGINDAVVAIDKEGKIIIFNERAQELLKRNSQDVVGEHLSDACQELSFMQEVLKSNVNRYNEIKMLKNLTINSNTSVLYVEGYANGVLCSFQDITKLQSLEKKIRYELNKKGLVAKYRFNNIITYDALMKGVISRAKKIGTTDSTVMIYGESGTGKEMIAQSMHNISARKNEPFVAVNCAAISENLLESELFGYEEGAFTGARKGGKPGLFELSHGGTIFLDEINSMSLSLQGKILRVLEEKEVMRVGSDYVIPLNVRIIAAANEDLKNKVKEGNFRSDLFYRLSVLEVHIPPLRNRKEDIVPLFMHYLNELSNEKNEDGINDEVKNQILNYTWPGNVRELKNVAQRYILFDEIDIESNDAIKEELLFLREDLSLRELYNSIEKKIVELLSEKGVSQTEIAKQIGISRTALWKKNNQK